MKKVIVIHETDMATMDEDVIGVANSIERAEGLIKEYYGKYKEIRYDDIREGMFEYSKVLEVLDRTNTTYYVKITLEWFEINQL